MKTKTRYQPRYINFIEVFYQQNISFKYYSISNRNSIATPQNIATVKQMALQWYDNMDHQGFATYDIAILMVHEVKEGVMGVLSRWVDENMLQTHVYLQDYAISDKFNLFSHNGINTCVWEIAVLWHERNAWVKHILMQSNKPAWKAYLQDQLRSQVC